MWDLKRFLNYEALIDDNGLKLTYADVEMESTKIASFVSGRCLVFVLCENSIGSVLGYISFVNNRIVPVMLNSHIDDSLLDVLLEKYQPEYLWIPVDNLHKFNNMDVLYKAYSYCLISTNFNKKYDLYDDLCLLLTTSGSTGSPKFVRQSYENVKSNLEAIIEYLSLDSSEKPIATLPMNYTYGLSIINSHLKVGATILLTNKGILQREFWDFFKNNNATSFGGVPYTYEMLFKMRFSRMNLPSLRYFTQAGGKLPVHLQQHFAEYAMKNGKKFFVMYGQCEATARISYLPAEYALEKVGSIGIPIPGGNLYLLDEIGNIVDEINTEGEMIYEGPNVTLGYADSGKDLIKYDEREGILKTGDIAKRDEDGFYYIVGRKKRFLKIYGNRVNLDEIDQIVQNKFDNIECVSGGFDDHLYIFITDDKKAEEIRDYISLKTGLNKAAFHIVQLDTIPKNEAGKIIYKELEKYYVIQ